MGSRNVIAIDVGRRRFRALLAARGRGAIKVRRALVDDVPDTLNFDDPNAVGQWVAERMRAAKFPRGDASIAIGREHVGLKRITLPTIDDSELPDMTRLAMQRELPFDAESAVIDFVPVERGPTSTTVLAVAVPQPVIDFATTMAKAAGLGIERITLRTMGAAALLNTMDAGQGFSILDFGLRRSPRPTTNGDPKSGAHAPASASGLAIDLTGEGVEFCMVVDGAVRFSRAAEVPQPQDQLAIADAVVTEARRTWMSYRVGDDSAGVGEALVMGDRRVSTYASGPLAEMLKVPVKVLESHPRIDAGNHDMDHFWPLAGLLLEPAIGGELIDFASPRKAPDVAAKTRQRRLLVACVAVVMLGAMYTLARIDLQSKRRTVDDLESQRSSMEPQFVRFWRDSYKLEHLRQWESVHVDWLKHATYLANPAISPPPDQVVLDSWFGSLNFQGVSYDKKTGKWSTDDQITIMIEGEARDRQTADAFREALVRASVYNTSTTSADGKGGKRMPFGFTYRLRTKIGSPAEPVKPTHDQPHDVASGAQPPAQATAVANLPPPAPNGGKEAVGK